MAEVIKFLDTVQDYNDFVGMPTEHPLCAVVDFSKYQTFTKGMSRYGIYGIMLTCNPLGYTISYGRDSYSCPDRTILFVSPGQLLGVEGEGIVKRPGGHAVFFHPDLLLGTPLERRIKSFDFFSYDVNEGLVVSDEEIDMLLPLMQTIKQELSTPHDKHTNAILAAYIEVLLTYCSRFFDRQFENRQESANTDLMRRIDNIVTQYLESEDVSRYGIPTVAWTAQQVHLSPNYFGDLVKRITGITAQEYIQMLVIEKAKSVLFSTDKTVSEIAYALGFKYPNHLSRMFKKAVGLTPHQYRVGSNPSRQQSPLQKAAAYS